MWKKQMEQIDRRLSWIIRPSVYLIVILFVLVKANDEMIQHQLDNGNSTELFRYSISAPGQQLRRDVYTVIDAFALALDHHLSITNSTTQSGRETVEIFEGVVKGALSYHFDQNIGGESRSPSTRRLQSMAKSINDTLESVNEVTDKLLSSSDGALHFVDLRNCLTHLVQQGGLHDGEGCVMNGMSITGVSKLIDSVVENFGGGMIPLNILSMTHEALDPRLSSMIPGEANFLEILDHAIRSVQESISTELVQALDDAKDCFIESAFVPMINYQQRLKLTETCNRVSKKNSHTSVYGDLKSLYLSITNQFVGYVIPNILDSIHQISNNYLSGNLSKFLEGEEAEDKRSHYFRQTIFDSIRSIVASNSGNQVTYAYRIAECLDSVIGTSDPESARNKAITALCLQRPNGPTASIQEIIYGYIQQVYGVLPTTISSQIETMGLQELDQQDPDYQKKVNELHQRFLESRPGPEYLSCYERFMDCLFNLKLGGILRIEEVDKNQITCILGDACRLTPDLQPNPVIRFD